MKKKSDLHEYQQLAIDFLYEHDNALAIMPTGSGKTVCSLTALQELMNNRVIRRPLIVAPIRVAQLVWQEECLEWAHLENFPLHYMAGPPEEWGSGTDIFHESRRLWGKYKNAEQREQTARAAELKKLLHSCNRVMRKNRINLPFDEPYLTSFENLQWLCDTFEPGTWPFDAIIFDEIGKLKSPKSKRFKALKRHMSHFKMVWGMTATPAPEGMLDMFTQVYLVDAGKRWGKSFYQWRDKHFYATDFQRRDWKLFPGEDKILYANIADIAFRVPNEMLTYQKTITPVHIDVKLPQKARDLFKSMVSKLVAEIEDSDDIVAMSQGAAAMKCRQIAQGFIYDDDKKPVTIHEEKMHALADLIDSMQKEPLLIAYEFEEDLAMIRKVWPNIPYIGSGVSKTTAALTRDNWNARKLPVMAVHPRSAGHGLNLQAGGSNICWFTMIWSLDAYQQTNERIDRQGQKQACFSHHIRAIGTADRRVYKALTDKRATQENVINAIWSL